MKTNKRTKSESKEAASAHEFPIYNPEPDEIADRAYAHFEAEGSEHGNDIEHWLAAEAGLLEENQSPPQA